MTASKVMSVAKSYIGTKESPAGSNNVIFNTDYYGHPVRDGSPNKNSAYPWCCVYVWDVFRIAGASALFYGGKKTDYCPAVHDWARKNGLIVAKDKGRYGDLILFDWNANGAADHIGFVVENKGGGNYTTIEGNTSLTSNDNGGKVMERNRKAKEVLAVIRPRYSESEPITAPEKKPASSVTAPTAGKAIKLNGVNLYASTSASIPTRKISGTYYLYDGKSVAGRYRITNAPKNVNRKPMILYVTGWIDKGAVV